MNNKIPKIIHYCWFGNNELSELNKKCIDSWKKFLPDYEIKEWNEKNYDFNSCVYAKEAYKCKKWAFVSDYARFDILNKFGGLYFDVDVELIKNIDDIISKGPFLGIESGALTNEIYDKSVLRLKKYDDINRVTIELGFSVNPGLGMCTYANNDIYEQVIYKYKNRQFIDRNGKMDTLTICDFVTEILVRNGIIVKDGIGLSGDISIYPGEYFNPKDYDSEKLNVTNNTRSIHHYVATWHTPIEEKIHDILAKCIQKYGDKKGRKIAIIKALPYSIINKIQQKGIFWTIGFVFKKIFNV